MLGGTASMLRLNSGFLSPLCDPYPVWPYDRRRRRPGIVQVLFGDGVAPPPTPSSALRSAKNTAGLRSPIEASSRDITSAEVSRTVKFGG